MEDPCQAAARASQECMDRANYNRDEVSTNMMTHPEALS